MQRDRHPIVPVQLDNVEMWGHACEMPSWDGFPVPQPQAAAFFSGDIPYMARKRKLIDTGTDKRYVRRNKLGTSFVESDDVGRSLAADRRKRAKTKVKSGEGDKGDRQRPRRKAASKGRKKAARKGAARKPARKKGAKRR